MEFDDCVVMSVEKQCETDKSPSVSRSSPTLSASAKKLVQGRLPFKPLHASQCIITDSVGAAAKKRKIVDSNANFQRVKNLKKEDSAKEQEIIEIDSNDESCLKYELCSESRPANEQGRNTELSELHHADQRDENVVHEVKAKVCEIVSQPENSLVPIIAATVADSSVIAGNLPCADQLSTVELHADTELVADVRPFDIDESSVTSKSSESLADAMDTTSSTDSGLCSKVVEQRPAFETNTDGSNASTEQPSSSSAATTSTVAEESSCRKQSTPKNKKEQRKSFEKKRNSLSKEEKDRLKAQEKEKKMQEKEEAKLKKIQERQEKEKEKEKEKAEKEKEKEKEKAEKEKEKAEKEKERSEKEKEKAEKKKQKEDERLRKQEQLLEEKKKREEAKLEEKKKKDEKREKEKQDEKVGVKEKELMQKFFVKGAEKTTGQKTQTDIQSGPFMNFQVKENMRLAPVLKLEPEVVQIAASNLDKVLHETNVVGVDQLYIGLLKTSKHCPKTFPPTWSSRGAAVEDVMVLPSSEQAAGCFMRAKLFQFHDNYRPAYYGTWRKHSSQIRPRNPFRLDKKFLDYEIDSDEEWEEEEPGESLSHSEPDDDDEEDGAEPDEDNDGFFVPHGYLSDGEGCEDDDDADKVDKGSPGKMKACQLAKARNWEAEIRCKKSEVLHPLVVGICWWTTYETVSDPIYNKLREFQIQLFEETPISTALKSEAHVKRKVKKAQDCSRKNITWLPFPDTALPDLVRLVHGNGFSIKKLVREFCEYWRVKTGQPSEAGGDNAAAVDSEKRFLLSKRQLEAKIRQIAVYESRPDYPRRKLWYINNETLIRLELMSSVTVPTEWKWLTKSVTS